MKNKLILVYPHTGIYGEVIKDLPLSLLYVASVVYFKGYRVRIIDQRVELDWKEKLLKELKERPLCVGISVMTGAPIRYALQISRIIKAYSKVPVVWGGIHPTILPEETLRDENIDIVVKGEGEITFYELTEALAQGKSLAYISGISYKEKGKIICNPLREPPDLDVLPDLPYELIDINNYYRLGYKEQVVSILTARGCPHRCTFCYAPAFFKRKWRRQSIAKVIQSLEIVIDRFHPGYICVLDDIFFLDQERVRRILEEVKRKNWKVKFDFRGVRIDDLYRMDGDFLSLLESSGTRNLHIGAESGSDRILKLMKKGIDVHQTISVNRRLKNYPSLRPTYNFFSGLPTETEEDIYASTNLILQLLRENPFCHMTVFNQFTPYPGTELFNLAVAHGYRPPESLEGWADLDPESSAQAMPWLSKRIKRLLETLYLTSYFIDKKLFVHFVSQRPAFKVLRALIHLYHPLARFRFKRHFTAFPIEVALKNLFFRYLKRKI